MDLQVSLKPRSTLIIVEQVPTAFILSTSLSLYGKHSSCLYPAEQEALAEVETLMLEVIAEGPC